MIYFDSNVGIFLIKYLNKCQAYVSAPLSDKWTFVRKFWKKTGFNSPLMVKRWPVLKKWILGPYSATRLRSLWLAVAKRLRLSNFTSVGGLGITPKKNYWMSNISFFNATETRNMVMEREFCQNSESVLRSCQIGQTNKYCKTTPRYTRFF